MRGCFFVFFLMLFCLSLTHAQLTKPNERTFQSQNFSDVAGSPYFFRDWSDGVIRFTNGRVMKQFKLKFDCAHNRLMLQFEGTAFGAESKVKEFVMYQKNGKKQDSVLFRKGFPAAENATAETFYQVLVDSKVKLLRLNIKNVIEQQQITGQSQYRHFEEEEKYFILHEGVMIPINKEKPELLEIFSDKASELKIFIEQEQLKMRSAADLARVVTKYNELVK